MRTNFPSTGLWPIWEIDGPPLRPTLPERRIDLRLYTIEETPELEEAANRAEAKRLNRENNTNTRHQHSWCCIPLIGLLFNSATNSNNDQSEDIELQNLEGPSTSNSTPSTSGLKRLLKKTKKPEAEPEKIYVKICDGLSSPDLSSEASKKPQQDQSWVDDTFERFQHYPRYYSAEEERKKAFLERWDREIPFRTDIREVTFPRNEPGHSNENPGPSNKDPGPSNEDQRPSKKDPGPFNKHPGPFNKDPGPSKRDRGPAKRYPGYSKRDSGSSNCDPGPSTRDLESSKRYPGYSIRVPGPSKRDPGPSTSEPGPSRKDPGPSNRQPGPSSWLPGPANRGPRPSNRQPGPFNWQPEPSNRRLEPSKRSPEPPNRRPGLFHKGPRPPNRGPGPPHRGPGPPDKHSGPTNRDSKPKETVVEIHNSEPPKTRIATQAEVNQTSPTSKFGSLKKLIQNWKDIARSQPVCSGTCDQGPQYVSTFRPSTPPSPAPDYIPTRPRRIRFFEDQEDFDAIYEYNSVKSASPKNERDLDQERRQRFKSLLALDSPDGNLAQPVYQFPRVIEDIVRERQEQQLTTIPRGPAPSGEKMNNLHPDERKVIVEFCHLLEKSKQFFNGLRELPVYGHRCWHPYFGRTFDVYTKLWKYQQQHRAILDTKYGLKRWQIGEIASKIGQLYYHFYLRTSEIAYLNEACSFYYAIRGRSYYTQACKLDKCELVVKKLRYNTRFIVVCLLLKKIKLVKELTKDLELLIREYGQAYDPEDHLEWVIVLDEIKAFIQLEVIVSVIHPDNYTVILSHRLSEYNKTPVERSPIMNITCQEIIIIGSTEHQAKFSELTLDMFRILQTVEREIPPDAQRLFDESPRQRQRQIPTLSLPKLRGSTDDGTGRDNPHKYLLYQPTPAQVLTYLASACNDLTPGGGLLLYISADGHYAQPSKYVGEAAAAKDLGGVLTSSKSEIYRQPEKDHRNTQAKTKESNCLYPIDVQPFTRRPLFIVVDSDNSFVFQTVESNFGQPLVILMSPTEVPPAYSDRRRQGNMFTLFLSCPFTGFCFITELFSASLTQWERSQELIDTYMCELSQIFIRSRVHTAYLHYLGDDFLRLMIYRYIFCDMALKMHKTFRTKNYLPKCSPPIPEEVIEHTLLRHIIYDLAKCLQVQNYFSDPSATSLE